MSYTVALQMDPIEGIDIYGDSSFVMGLEAQKRGYPLYHYLPQALSWQNGKVIAQAQPLTLRYEAGNHYTLGKPVTLDLATDVDVILMRQDPPFDMAYITATHLLEQIADQTLVVNNPAAVRNAPEKLLPLHFSHLMPPSLISRDSAAIKAFRAEQGGEIIVKPLFGNGGAGVFHVKKEDPNLSALLEMFLSQSREPLMAQAYLPEIKEGDKRIILVDGKAVGALNRIPPQGEARANLHVGGTAYKTTITDHEQKICDAIGGYLRDNGLLFVGIDVIGDYLTEINVTSPTGIQEINRLDNTCIEAQLWDVIEGKL